MGPELSPRHEDGFSLIEVLVAALITVVGLIGTLSLIDGAQATTSVSQSRDGATALHREVVEIARGLPYDRLTPGSVVAEVQQRPGLADGRVDDRGWTVHRRGVTFRITLGVCSVDDPRDGSGAHTPGEFCLSGTPATAQECASALDAGPGATTARGDCGLDVNGDGTIDGLADASGSACTGSCQDSAPADYKRVVALVRWLNDGRSGWMLQSTTVANPGAAGAPAIASLTQPASAVTSGTSLAFAAHTTIAAVAVGWSVDGTPAGSATGSASAWSFTWSLGAVSSGSSPSAGEVLDGAYVIGAKAFDAHGQSGSARSSTVQLNRRAPYPVPRFEAGRHDGGVNFEWSPPKERDVVGYRVYHHPAAGTPVLVCSTDGTTTCREASAPAGERTYVVVALDTAPGGAVREGAASDAVTVTEAGTAPGAPQSLQATSVAGGTTLRWTAPASGAEAVDHYVIYRDGEGYANRYDRTGTGAELEYTDTRPNAQTHTYRVTAVGTQLAESAPTEPVTR